MNMGNGSKTLYLELRKELYEMIERGEKMEEYRVIKTYWIRRLLTVVSAAEGIMRFRGDYGYVCFSYGFRKRTMTFEISDITIGYGRPEWGAPRNKRVFIIKFNKRVNDTSK